METTPNPSYHLFRNIDWQLFNNLKGTRSPLK